MLAGSLPLSRDSEIVGAERLSAVLFRSMSIAVATALASSAGAILIDEFDSYADNAALTAAWTVNAGSGLVLNTAQSVSTPNSVVNPGTDAAFPASPGGHYHYVVSPNAAEPVPASLDPDPADVRGPSAILPARNIA